MRMRLLGARVGGPSSYLASVRLIPGDLTIDRRQVDSGRLALLGDLLLLWVATLVGCWAFNIYYFGQRSTPSNSNCDYDRECD